MTRVKELIAEGINVSFGSDDIFDPWNPLGNANMRDQVFMGLYTGHMLGYEEICNSYKFVTENAARTCIWETLTALRSAKMQTLLFLTLKTGMTH